ncbi:hypothetical protein ACTAQI_13385 [Pseudarthrobacter sp. alpha12b]
MPFFTAFVTSKLAAGLVAGATIAAGGAATVAYTTAPPAPVLRGGQDAIAPPAPAAAPTTAEQPDYAPTGKEKAAEAPGPHPDAAPVGPDATGPAAFGLCTAFTAGGLDSGSTAYQALSDAANGSAGIAAYCTSVPVPGQSTGNRPKTPEKPGASGPSSPKETPSAQAGKGQAHKPAAAGKP